METSPSPYIQNPQTVVKVPKYTKLTSIPSSEEGIASGEEEPSRVGGTTPGEALIHGDKTTRTALRTEAVNTVGAALTNKGMIAEQQE